MVCVSRDLGSREIAMAEERAAPRRPKNSIKAISPLPGLVGPVPDCDGQIQFGSVGRKHNGTDEGVNHVTTAKATTIIVNITVPNRRPLRRPLSAVCFWSRMSYVLRRAAR